MTINEHTPEPWSLEDMGTEPMLSADAGRIVECVNAMEGVGDPAAFMGAVQALVKEARAGALHLDLYPAGKLNDALYFFRTFTWRNEDV